MRYARGDDRRAIGRAAISRCDADGADCKRDFEVTVDPDEDGTLVSVDDGEEMDVIGDWAPGEPLLVVDIDGRQRVVQVARKGRDWTLTTRGAAHHASVMARHIAAMTRHMIEKVPPDMSRFLIAPMPGLLTRLEVKVGDTVEAGQPVAVVEAMKMENILRAAKARPSRACRPESGIAWRRPGDRRIRIGT